MKITIDSASQFRDAFHRANRGTQFSYEALGLLFDYFEECDPDMELDVNRYLLRIRRDGR